MGVSVSNNEKPGWYDADLGTKSFFLGSLRPQADVDRRWFTVVGHELRWRPEEEAKSTGAGVFELPQFLDNPLAAAVGELPLTWIAGLQLDAKNPSVIEMETTEAVHVQLKAATPEDAKAWYDCIQKAHAGLQKHMSGLNEDGLDADAVDAKVSGNCSTNAGTESTGEGTRGSERPSSLVAERGSQKTKKDKGCCCTAM